MSSRVVVAAMVVVAGDVVADAVADAVAVAVSAVLGLDGADVDDVAASLDAEQRRRLTSAVDLVELDTGRVQRTLFCEATLVMTEKGKI